MRIITVAANERRSYSDLNDGLTVADEKADTGGKPVALHFQAALSQSRGCA